MYYRNDRLRGQVVSVADSKLHGRLWVLAPFRPRLSKWENCHFPREDWSLVIVFAVNCPLENNRYSVEKAIKISRKRSVFIDVQDISNEE